MLYLGNYSVNRSGSSSGGFKITLPKKIMIAWGVKEKDNLHFYANEDTIIITQHRIESESELPILETPPSRVDTVDKNLQNELDSFRQQLSYITSVINEQQKIPPSPPQKKIYTKSAAEYENTKLEDLPGTLQQKINEIGPTRSRIVLLKIILENPGLKVAEIQEIYRKNPKSQLYKLEEYGIIKSKGVPMQYYLNETLNL